MRITFKKRNKKMILKTNRCYYSLLESLLNRLNFIRLRLNVLLRDSQKKAKLLKGDRKLLK